MICENRTGFFFLCIFKNQSFQVFATPVEFFTPGYYSGDGVLFDILQYIQQVSVFKSDFLQFKIKINPLIPIFEFRGGGPKSYSSLLH